MPNYSITTTLRPTVFTGDYSLNGVSFKNGSTAGILYFINRQNRNDTVSSTNYDFSLTAGQSVEMTFSKQGPGMFGPWDVISDTAGGVTLEIIPFYQAGKLR